MITGIDLRELRNAEFLQFMKNTASLVAANDAAALNVTSQHTALQNQVTGLQALFKVSQASEITLELSDLDNHRDKAITGIGKIIDGYLSHYDPMIVAHAKKLSDNLGLYGPEINRQNYQSETATLNAIISDWETKPGLSEALLALNLVEWKKELKNTNASFDEKYLDRTKDYGAISPDTLKAEREKTNQAYYTLRDWIVAFATVQSSAAYTKTINDINALVEQYNTLLRNRVGETPEAPPAE